MSLQSEMLVEQKVSNAQKSTGTAYLLWFFLGGFGAHCSGLLIPDTDLGENPRRERGV